MSDRVNALTVALEADTRDDDVIALMAAITQLRNVAGVTTHVVDVSDYVAAMRIRRELRETLFNALKD